MVIDLSSELVNFVLKVILFLNQAALITLYLLIVSLRHHSVLLKIHLGFLQLFPRVVKLLFKSPSFVLLVLLVLVYLISISFIHLKVTLHYLVFINKVDQLHAHVFILYFLLVEVCPKVVEVLFKGYELYFEIFSFIQSRVNLVLKLSDSFGSSFLFDITFYKIVLSVHQLGFDVKCLVLKRLVKLSVLDLKLNESFTYFEFFFLRGDKLLLKLSL